MKYTFYVMFLANRNPLIIIAWLIRLSIKRKYNHVEIMAVPFDKKFPVLFYGSVMPKSRVATIKEVQKKYKIIEQMELKKQTNLSDLEILIGLSSKAGKPYAYQSYFWLLPMSCFWWLKRKLSKIQIDGESKMNCCEFVARSMVDYFGYKIKTSFDAVEFEDIKVALKE